MAEETIARDRTRTHSQANIEALRAECEALARQIRQRAQEFAQEVERWKRQSYIRDAMRAKLLTERVQ